MSDIKRLFGGKKKSTPAPVKQKDPAQVNAEQRDKEKPSVMGRGELLLGNQSVLSSGSETDTTSRNKILGN